MSDGAYVGTARSQPARLAVLTDVVYGVALVLVSNERAAYDAD